MAQDAGATARARGVFGVARIVCALETDRVVSKSCWGLHALAEHPVRYRVVREVLAAHDGAMERVLADILSEGLADIRDPIAAATGQAIPRDEGT